MFKYVMFNNGLQDVPIVFPKMISHATIAEMITSHEETKHYKLVSAGFISFNPISIQCYGSSETLNINSRQEDADIILTHPWCCGLSDLFSIELVKETLLKRGK